MPTKKRIKPELRKFFSKLGKVGGARSKREITPEQQLKMQKARRKAARAARKS